MPIIMAKPRDQRRLTSTTEENSKEEGKKQNALGSKLDTDEAIYEFVQQAYDQVMKRRSSIKTDVLRKYLLKFRDNVLSLAPFPKQNMFNRLPTNATPAPDVLLSLYCRPCENERSSRENTTSDKANPDSETCNDDVEKSNRYSKNDTLGDKTKKFTVKMRGGSVKDKTCLVSLPAPITLQGTHTSRPFSSATIFLKTHYVTEDEKKLKYVPYFGDDDKEDVVSELYNLEDREKQMEFGSEYQERDTNDIIDETLAVMCSKLQERGVVTEDMKKERTPLQTRLNESLANIMDEYLDRIHERCQLLFCKEEREYQEEIVENEPKVIPSYLEAVDTYRNLFCRRCFVYDCNMHGNLGKPSLEIQGDLALRKELEGFWNESRQQGKQDGGKKLLVEVEAINDTEMRSIESTAASHAETLGNKRVHDEIISPVISSFTATDKVLCERAFFIFQGDIDKIASVLGAPRALVEEYVNSANVKCQGYEDVKEDIENEAKKRKKKRNFDKSMNNYNLAWLKRVEGAEIHPMFIPCDHDGPCSEENCSCIKNAFFCTKHCVWGLKGRNCFRGCACKGRCTTGACSCFAAKRECDPDLCTACEACMDPPNKPATQQRCRNDNIGMRRHCHLLLGLSTIEDAGWGIYTKTALKKGDFVHEYVGEVISQEEAERRGRIYDKVNRSYLFNLTSDLVVDASRKGNKSRFANHSQKPNCYTKMVIVNGDVRIGLYAKDDIEAQSEVSLLQAIEQVIVKRSSA